MQLVDAGQQMQFIDVDSDRVPCALLCKLTDRTYRLEFDYNETGDFFTVSLALSGSGGNTQLCYNEVLRLGKPLFEAFNDERYPLPLLVPLCLNGDDIEAITYDNFGTKVKVYLLDRPSGGE